MAFVRKRRGKWRIRFVDASGRQVERTTLAVSKVEARRMAEDLERQAERVRLGLERAIQLKTFSELWSEYQPIAKTKSSWTTIKGRFINYLVPAFGPKLVHQITAGDIDTFLAGRLKTDDNPDGLSPQTCEHLRVHLSAIFTFAIKSKVLTGENPAKAAERPEIPEVEPRSLDGAEIRPLLAHVPDRWRGFFAVAVYTGMRRGEIIGLKVSSVNLEARFIAVSRSHAKGTKSARIRYIPISDELLPYLKVELGRVRSEWLFPSKKGGRLSKNTKLIPILERAMRKAGLIQGYDHTCRTRGKAKGCGSLERRADDARSVCPECGRRREVVPVAKDALFKDLRSTFGTHITEQTGDLRVAQKLLGHATQRTTERYAKARDRHMLAAVNRMSFNESKEEARPGPAPKNDVEQQETPKDKVSPIC